MKTDRRWYDQQPTTVGPLHVTYRSNRKPPTWSRLHPVNVFLGLLLLALLILAACLLGAVTP